MEPRRSIWTTPGWKFPKAVVLGLCIVLAGYLSLSGLIGHSSYLEPVVVGPPTFVLNTYKALGVLAAKAPAFYELMVSNLSKIKPGSRTRFVAVQGLRFVEISEYDANGPIIWYAAVLVHEALHAKLYGRRWWRGLIPLSEKATSWRGRHAEMVCLTYQADALLVLGYNPAVAERVRRAWRDYEYWIAPPP